MLHVRLTIQIGQLRIPYAPGLVGPQPGACIGAAARAQGAMMRTTTKTCWLSGVAMSLLTLGCGESPTTPAEDAKQVPSQLVLRTQPSGAVLGEPLTTQPVLEVQDASGNLVTVDRETVVTAAIGSGGGMAGGNRTAVAVGGVITFADLAIGGRVGEHTLVFTAEAGSRVSGLAPVTSQSFELLPGAADAVIRLSGHDQRGSPSERLDTLAVIVTGSDGNAASGESSAWSVLSGGGSLEVLDGTTDADGLSRAVWELGGDRGVNTATATVAGKGAVTFRAAAAMPLTVAASALTDPVEAPLAGVYIHGNHAFVGGMSVGYTSGANHGVRIVDVSNPSAPVRVGRIPLRRRGFLESHSHGDAVATHIASGACQGDVAIVLYGVPDEFSSVAYPAPYGIWDVTNPGNPTFLSVLNLGNGALGLEGGDLGDKPYDGKAVAGNYFYALYNMAATIINQERQDARLAVVDISDPGNPVVVGDWQDNSDVNNDVWLMGLSVNQSGTRAYVTGLWPPPYHFESTHGYLYILDIQNPSQPTELGRYVFPLLGTPSSVSIARPTSDDALVVLADHSWDWRKRCGILHILDTSNPAAIREISSFASRESPHCGPDRWVIATDVAIRENLVYSTWLNGGVLVTDISDPTDPVEVAQFLSNQLANPQLSDVALLGTDLVVATTVWWSGMYVLSLP